MKYLRFSRSKHWVLILISILLFSPLAFADPVVSTFSLINTKKKKTIRGYHYMSESVKVDLKKIGTSKISVQAQMAPESVGKVEFFIDGVLVATDKKAPYGLLGTNGNKYVPWNPAPGRYRVTALGYDQKTGKPGVASSIDVSIVNGEQTGTATPPETGSEEEATEEESEEETAPEVSPTPDPDEEDEQDEPTDPVDPVDPPEDTPPTPPGGAETDEVKVFPGATGFGTDSTAGSGRHLSPPSTTVHRVTNLNDSGSGSLRACAEASAPRVCIFEVSGRVVLSTPIEITSPYLTIAGQTAPSPGVMVTNAGLKIKSHDILIQHLQVRIGDDDSGPSPGTRDGIVVASSSSKAVYNVVLDHLTVSWAIDENFSTYYPNTNDITLSNSIIAEALHNSIHPKGPHSKGALIGDFTQRITLHNNLFAHNHDRNPRLKYGSSVEFVNNVVYNWGGTSSWNTANLTNSEDGSVATHLHFLGNYFKAGVDGKDAEILYASPIASSARIFARGNIGPTRPSDSGSEWTITKISSSNQSTSPVFTPSDVVEQTPGDAYASVLYYAGSRPRERNSADSRVVAEVSAGTGSIKDCVSGCTRNAGGWPTLPVVTRSLNIPNNPYGDDDSDGYTNLEEWLHDFYEEVTF